MRGHRGRVSKSTEMTTDASLCDLCYQTLIGGNCRHCEQRRASPWVRMLEGLLGAIAVGVIVWHLALLLPAFQPRHRGQGTACKSNLKNLGTALEMYSTDNGGRYPRSLHAVTPNYLRRVPSCPSVGRDTYSTAYTASSLHGDEYTMVCEGWNHRGIGYSANYPQYTSRQGLMER